MARGRLITIEGIDGAGKTTLAAGLADGAAGARASTSGCCASPAACARPSGSASSSRIPSCGSAPRAEALLYAAARAQLVEEALEPLLSAGSWVLLDRFVDSSLAYQGAGRRLGVEAVRAINEFATGGLTPDRTLLLSLAPVARPGALAGARRRHSIGSSVEDARVPRADRRAPTSELAAAEPARIRTIDAAAARARARGGARRARGPTDRV